ncbi:MAG: cation diffusion facilitator family transporter [Gammaproteobacteria bacterium]|nr:cation diffusion facilitator family transporter [Gammaproteobacteria bacterium]OYZ04824.1 MAG: divalent metal cation transporter FieF [Thiotrichales bacterium 16-46-22]OZA95788.1 MAG: divalent metal cation transporter FieF [Thiotrichales bacterium 34-46-19]UCG19077.1 MAG: cation diffusion facilitator family transporter [Thiotrichales bacterium]HQT02012.1 cation diffusion facilitator family transporter [Thiotrichales bacterium]
MTTENRLVRLATYVAVAVAIILVLIKLYAWLRTGSASILASLLDSTVDILASLIIMYAVMISQAPADKEHRFGHGKAEPLASLAQSAFIAGSAVYLILYAIESLWMNSALQQVTVGLWVMALSLALTTLLVIFQYYVIQKTKSTAIQSDALHYVSDILTTGLVILGLLLSQLQWLDPILAILIALWIMRSAYTIGRDSVNQLMDGEIDEDMRAEVIRIILATPKVQGYNDLRTYRAGPNCFVQFDLELDDQLTLFESHAISENVVNNLKATFANLDVMVHQEPVSFRHDADHHQWGTA